MAFNQFYPPVCLKPHVQPLVGPLNAATRAAIWTHVKVNLFEWPTDIHPRVVDLGVMGITDFTDLLNLSETQIETQLVTATAAGAVQLWPLHE
jgi:hypothetical protein